MSTHIAIVEDDPNLLDLYSQVVENGGHTAHPFTSFLGVLELLELGSPVDLLITDISLREGSPHGISLAAMARQRRPGLPVIFITGHPEYAKYIVENDTFLLKPVGATEILAAITAGLHVADQPLSPDRSVPLPAPIHPPVRSMRP